MDHATPNLPLNVPMHGPAINPPPKPPEADPTYLPTNRRLRRIFTKPWLLLIFSLILIIGLLYLLLIG